MPRPYSVDLRERALLACEEGEEDYTALARRFRVGVSTLRLWRKQAREEGRRVPRPLERGPAPLDGDLLLLNEFVAEYAEMLAARTGKPRRSAPALCRALKRLGWVRKQRRSGLASRTVWTWQPVERRGARAPPRSTRLASSSSTRVASTRA